MPRRDRKSVSGRFVGRAAQSHVGGSASGSRRARSPLLSPAMQGQGALSVGAMLACSVVEGAALPDPHRQVFAGGRR